MMKEGEHGRSYVSMKGSKIKLAFYVYCLCVCECACGSIVNFFVFFVCFKE